MLKFHAEARGKTSGKRKMIEQDLRDLTVPPSNCFAFVTAAAISPTGSVKLHFSWAAEGKVRRGREIRKVAVFYLVPDARNEHRRILRADRLSGDAKLVAFRYRELVRNDQSGCFLFCHLLSRRSPRPTKII